MAAVKSGRKRPASSQAGPAQKKPHFVKLASAPSSKAKQEEEQVSGKKARRKAPVTVEPESSNGSEDEGSEEEEFAGIEEAEDDGDQDAEEAMQVDTPAAKDPNNKSRYPTPFF